MACDEKMCYGRYGAVLRDVTGCVMELCYWALLGAIGQTPTKSYWITELVGVFLIILLWFRSRDLLKYLSIVLW